MKSTSIAHLPQIKHEDNIYYKGKTYGFFTGLRPKFETIRSLLLNRERSLSFDKSMVHVNKEESRLWSMQAPISHESQILLSKNATVNIT